MNTSEITELQNKIYEITEYIESTMCSQCIEMHNQLQKYKRILNEYNIQNMGTKK